MRVTLWSFLLSYVLMTTRVIRSLSSRDRGRQLWTAYQANFSQYSLPVECQELYKYEQPPAEITANNKYRLWPGLMSQFDLATGESLFGLEEAMEIIWRNQNPENCSTARYYIADSWAQGFGSETHVLGVGLALALATGRVYLQDPRDDRRWRIRTPHCISQSIDKRNASNLECYFEPWSSRCTIHDALEAVNRQLNSCPSCREREIRLRRPWLQNETDALLNFTRESFREEERMRNEQQHVPHDVRQSQLKSKLFAMLPDRTTGQIAHRLQKVTHGSSLHIMELHMNPLWNVIMQETHRVRTKTFMHTTGPDGKRFPLRVNAVHYLAVNDAGEVHEAVDEEMELPFRDVEFLTVGAMLNLRKFVPLQLRKLLLQPPCSPISPGREHFWWRAVAATYLLRPNAATLRALRAMDNEEVLRSDGHCVSTYVRHGDKGSEMRLVPFARYATAAEGFWNHSARLLPKGSATDSLPQRIFYFGTEDAQVVVEAKDWASKKNVSLHHLTIIKDVHRKGMEHPDFYLSMLANLQNILRCRATICTYLSNFCRVVDELRATVAGKANRYYAEVNEEACENTETHVCIARDATFAPKLFEKIDPMLW